MKIKLTEKASVSPDQLTCRFVFQRSAGKAARKKSDALYRLERDRRGLTLHVDAGGMKHIEPDEAWRSAAAASVRFAQKLGHGGVGFCPSGSPPRAAVTGDHGLDETVA